MGGSTFPPHLETRVTLLRMAEAVANVLDRGCEREDGRPQKPHVPLSLTRTSALRAIRERGDLD